MGQEAFDTGSFQDYISLGLLADHDSEAYQYAEEIRAKLNRGRPVSNIEMGQLTAAVYADALGVGEKRTEGTQEEPDEEIWDRVFDEEENDDFRRELAEEFGLDEPAGQEVLTDEDPGDKVETHDDIPPVTSAASRALIAEVQARGDKISPDEVLGITRDLSGQIVWLEKGNLGEKPSGLTHILDRHEKELNAAGITSHNIPNFVLTAVAKGKIIGYQGNGTGRAIYEFEYHGTKYKIAVSVGSNGYIVGANLRGRGR
jgi:filamentous hemagglutinin